MKKLSLVLVAFLFAVTGILAQTPNEFKYQAVLRDADGIMAEENVSVYLEILQGNASGTSIFNETHDVTTTAQGLININIGSISDLSVVGWSSDAYFVKITVSGTVMGTSQLLSVPYAMHAKTAETITGATSLAIGDSYGGGIIFWLDASGQHGLIAATTDQSTGIRWSEGFTETAATGDGVGAGEMNTMLIVSEQRDGSYAAQLCADLVITDGGVDYGDWYLPSRYELNLMYLQKETIGGFSEDYYWSSTEHATNHAREVRFSDGYHAWEGKNVQSDVRAIRAF